MEKNTQFDLEQQLIDCWGICEDLDTIFESMYEQDILNKDELANMLLGLKTLYHYKFQKCFSTFETYIHEKYRAIS